jgi:hypothetical protein
LSLKPQLPMESHQNLKLYEMYKRFAKQEEEKKNV